MAFTNINYNDPAAMDPLVKALIYRESRGNPNAVSPVGAQGLGQVMPATAANPGFGVAPLKNPFDPAENEAFTRKYLAAMLSRYNGDVEPALAAYNAGPGNADKFAAAGGDFASLPKPSETMPYVNDIMAALGKGGGGMSVSTRDFPGASQMEQSGMAPQLDEPVPEERKGVIQQLMGGDYGGAVKSMFTEQDNGALANSKMYGQRSNAIEDAGKILDASMANTNAPISWLQVLGSAGNTVADRYTRNKEEGEKQKVSDQLTKLISSGNKDPKTIALISALDPDLGRALMVSEDSQQHDMDMLEARNQNALELEQAKTSDPTALYKNLVAGGFTPGTPEFQAEMMRQLNNEKQGMTATVGPDGTLTFSQGGGGGIMPSAPGGAPGPAATGVPAAPGVVAPAPGAPTLAPGTDPIVGGSGPVTGVGKAPEGQVQFIGPDGTLQESAIPGGKTDVEAKAQAEKLKNDNLATARQSNTVIGKIDQARSFLNGPAEGEKDNRSFIDKNVPSTGFVGQLTSGIGGLPSAKLRSMLDTIAANIGFDKLAEMRRNSPNGAALGNVTERELALLQSTIASIDPDAGEELVKRGLDEIERQYQDIYNRLPPETQKIFAASPGEASAPPPVKTPEATGDIKTPSSQEELDAYPVGTIYKIGNKTYKVQ